MTPTDSDTAAQVDPASAINAPPEPSLQSATNRLRAVATSLVAYQRFAYIFALHGLLQQAADACEIYQPSDHPTAHKSLCQAISSANGILGPAYSSCSRPELAVALRDTGEALAYTLSAWAANPPNR